MIHGAQYIDEIVMLRVKDKGDMYVHQDANWNVIGATDLGGHVVDCPVYTPYGQFITNQDTSFGDRDGDGDVDSSDKGTPGTTCTGTVSGACRILDLDFDGDYDSTDADLFDYLDQGNARHPGRYVTAVDQPFGHQGLWFDAEIGSYQNRARQYDPRKRRWLQRDPVGYADALSHYVYVGSRPATDNDPSGNTIRVEDGSDMASVLENLANQFGVNLVVSEEGIVLVFGEPGNPVFDLLKSLVDSNYDIFIKVGHPPPANCGGACTRPPNGSAIEIILDESMTFYDPTSPPTSVPWEVVLGSVSKLTSWRV